MDNLNFHILPSWVFSMSLPEPSQMTVSNEGTRVQGLAHKQLVKPHANHIIGSWLPLASFIQAQHGQLRTNCVWLLRG